MTNEVIFYTQIASIVAFIVALFTIYNVLVQAKEAALQVLRERLIHKDEQIASLRAQTSDALVSILNDRIKVTQDEIGRLRADGDSHRSEIKQKEGELQGIQDKLSTLSDLIRDSDLVCPECGEPLLRRHVYTIYGGQDGEADVEFVEYQCGLAINEFGEMRSHCRNLEA
jgi:uncharacterized small protein (DUF1192 family)